MYPGQAHATAAVSFTAIVHGHATVGPCAVLMDRVEIGDGSRVGAGAVVEEGVIVGENVVIGPNATVSADVPDGTVLAPNTNWRGPVEIEVLVEANLEPEIEKDAPPPPPRKRLGRKRGGR